MIIPEDVEKFPVLKVLNELSESLERNSTTLLQAPPGAGKSTILPLHLFKLPFLRDKKIIVVEPRRLAAKMVAAQLSVHLGESPGNSAGYIVRFENRYAVDTKILVVTEGIFINMLQRDPGLTDFSLVILDEFHERSIQADLSLMMLRQSQQHFRQDIRILIMSATLESERLSKILKAPLIKSVGKQFPVSLEYIPAAGNGGLAEKTASTLKQIFKSTQGDILVFLPGTGEIRRLAALLEEINFPAQIVMLYGDMSFDLQQKALNPVKSGKRKIILSTSIAETSLTIEGIHVVVDTGYARVPQFNPHSGLTRLVTIPVSLDRANQRAGRAGRLGPGVCYRMWPEAKTSTLVPNKKPEVVDADLSPVLLELFKWGVTNPNTIEWIDQPPRGHINQALDVLQNLGFLDGFKLTANGVRASDFATHPRFAAMILAAGDDAELRLLCCDLLALLEERDPLSDRLNADIFLRLKLIKDFRDGIRVAADKGALDRLIRLADAWRGILNIKHVTTDYISLAGHLAGSLLAAAFPDRLGRQIEKWSNRYKVANGTVLSLDKHDPLIHAQFLVIAEADSGFAEGKIFLAAPVDPFSIPGIQRESDVIKWNSDQEQFFVYRRLQAGTLVLEERQIQLGKALEIKDQLISKIQEMGFKWAGLDDRFQQTLARLQSFTIWQPDGTFPDFSEQALMNGLDLWLRPFLDGVTGRAGLNKLDWEMILMNRLSYDQRLQFEKLIPEKLIVPSGSAIRLNYFEDGRAPELHVRLQEVFGLLETPRIFNGKVSVIMNLLSPAYRPVQVTADLRNFWSSTYFEVRKELRSRYPKHHWPDNPLEAIAVRGVRRKK